MTQFSIILSIAIFGLITLFIWNGINFRTLKKYSRYTDAQLNDSKYWELKSKYEFTIAIVALITATAGFLGYNSLQSIENAIKLDFNKKVDSVKLTFQSNYHEVNARLLSAKDSVKSLDNKVSLSQKQLQNSAKILSILTKQQFQLKESGYQSKKELSDLSNQIDSINTKNKIKREFYLIPNFEFIGALSNNDKLIKIKFSSLKTISGDRLPIFQKSPIILSALSNTTEFKIFSIDKDGFTGILQVYGVPDNEVAKHSYFISFIIYPVD